MGTPRKEFLRHNSEEGLYVWNFSLIPAMDPGSGASVAWGCLASQEDGCPLHRPGTLARLEEAGPELSQSAGLPGSLPPLRSWHSRGTAINYAQRVPFQFKCALIPEEQLMALSY